MTDNQKQQIDSLRNQGYGYKKIAERLDISVNTVASHCRRKADKCLQCGTVLTHTPKHRKKKFCSDKCRMAWWNTHQDSINRKPSWIVCKQCGKPFDARYKLSRKFCSRKCYADSRRKDGKTS
ncbi:MAG: helix-turn-helix domain-containing protein [Clostridium sp.]|nr:helix-turn-helix domain-containing protein [Clostridium sp.]